MKNLPIICDNCESKYSIVIEIEDETVDYTDPEFCSFCGDLLYFNELKFKDNESYSAYDSDEEDGDVDYDEDGYEEEED